MDPLVDDLLAETADLVSLLRPLDEAGWDTPTPAPGWTVRDQVSHLAYFDEMSVAAVNDPERFTGERAELANRGSAYVDDVAARHRHLTGAELLAWFTHARDELAELARGMDPKARVPWYGPDMGALSFLTARLMETWAHGQDVADGLGVDREATPRLRHVCHLGVRAIPNSYLVRGLRPPETPIRVELAGPDGEAWTWGPEDAADAVRGPALDFCLVVTQRRHPDDTGLVTRGPVASEWISIAQAFAGPPGPGRRPGQFRRDQPSEERP
ncbi:MAG: TIGR03084 family protein [Streptosporangiales bacterium]|nr:TIGR03084 family protein [Streptosporangiales bacterium]